MSRLLILTPVVVWLVAPAAARAEAVSHAQKLYQRTDYAGAIQALLADPSPAGPANLLIGKSYYMLGDFKKASTHLERAVAADPGNSEYYDWLGKAYGRRAETSSPFTAPGLASKARRAFEKAVELDPNNIEAINDLFEYYLNAPGFLGGGLDKARALADRIQALEPAEYHFAQARLAEKRKEFSTAEQQLRRAVDLAPRQVSRLIDLGKFLSQQGKVHESEAAFRQAEKLEPNNPRLLFERASSYIQAGRNLDEARDMLKRYLEAPLGPDDPPRREAEKLLRQSSGG